MTDKPKGIGKTPKGWTHTYHGKKIICEITQEVLEFGKTTYTNYDYYFAIQLIKCPDNAQLIRFAHYYKEENEDRYHRGISPLFAPKDVVRRLLEKALEKGIL